MTDETTSNSKEVTITKRKTNMDSEEYVSVSLKSNDDTIDILIDKAMFAATNHGTVVKKPGLEAIR